ncbi:MAG: hypothetical protein JEZ11_23140 [Desulfobacterales bacterium]|nr:hypothetical protein [Desulfobacterales bacterium]
MIETIRNAIPREEFDYQMLLDALAGYARPRDKISDWLQKGVIVRIKKGLYVFGEGLRRSPYSRELLANLVYGPSYLSLDWALQYYGLIPERVEAMTSVTTGRSRKFHTPAGLFVYRQVPLQAFRTGMTRVETTGNTAFLIATREKAIADKIRSDRGVCIGSARQLSAYLTENLRIDEAALAELSPRMLAEFGLRYGSRKIRLFADFVDRVKGKIAK